MSKSTGIILAIVILLLIIALGAGAYFYFTNQPEEQAENAQNATTNANQEAATSTNALSLDPKAVATHLSKVADAKGVYWMRGFDLLWNELEPKQGTYDWETMDMAVKQFQKDNIYPLVIVKPFANWDQETCHPDSEYDADNPMGGILKVGAPCDMDAYTNFLAKAVERYNGDGKDDMPGLETPIKYWEIMNEPSMQGGVAGGMGEELKFFVGTSQEYFDILKASFNTIKKADPEAKVAHAGMAGMQQNFQDFWDPVFDLGAGDYFDIANIHTINTDTRREDLYVIKFKEYLEEHGVTNKPIWITEVQYGELTGEPADLEAFHDLIVKSSVFSLALGADTLFYIENWLFWGNEEALKPPPPPPPGEEKDPLSKDAKEPLPEGEFDKPPEGEFDKPKKKELKSMKDRYGDISDNTTQKVYLNLVDKINDFDKVITIKEEYKDSPSQQEGATSTLGQYKFVNGDEVVYAMWGAADLPEEITGEITVTDINGVEKTMDASELTLTDTPVFVEMVE